MKLIITGSRGWIGSAIVEKAKIAGYNVVEIDLPAAPSTQRSLYRAADVGNDRFLDLATDPALRSAEVIIHCAGIAHRATEGPSELELFESVNHLGTRRVLELARHIGAMRIVYLSSIALYDWRGSPGLVAETGPLHPTTGYAHSKLQGERAAIESGLDYRVARLATVFGVGDRANFAKLADALSRKRFILPGRGEAQKSVLPIDLAAELLLELATRSDLSRTVMNLALPRPAKLNEICRAFCHECGFHNPLRLPLSVLHLAGVAGDYWQRVFGRSPLTSEIERKLVTSTVVDCNRMLRAFPNRNWDTFESALKRFAEYYASL